MKPSPPNRTQHHGVTGVEPSLDTCPGQVAYGQEPGAPVGDDRLLSALTEAVARAAASTLGALREAPNARIKADGSPVTDADERSQAILVEAAARLMPGVPVVAEEMASHPAQTGGLFLLIDPLDGTKEYIAGSADFTVNLAVVRAGVPSLGIIAVPAAGLIFRGRIGSGAERLRMAADGSIAGRAQSIQVRQAPPRECIAAVSRSHLDPATAALLDRLGVTRRVPAGSAVKFCRVAEGAVDLYPRLATTCEWDVAAGHALVAAAGGAVTTPEGGSLEFGRAAHGYRVPAFIAWGDRAGVIAETA